MYLPIYGLCSAGQLLPFYFHLCLAAMPQIRLHAYVMFLLYSFFLYNKREP